MIHTSSGNLKLTRRSLNSKSVFNLQKKTLTVKLPRFWTKGRPPSPTAGVKNKQLEQRVTIILNHSPAPGGLASKSLSLSSHRPKLQHMTPPSWEVRDVIILGPC